MILLFSFSSLKEEKENNIKFRICNGNLSVPILKGHLE